ncbi:MAG: hypothetical protein CSA81_05505 [Acidobacteria bacterium]|nr:MAG: hypothetical protein CSA81_05505 [Acidobacteriota bacterium]PIE90955.1 MAG: hypothetical protein CR997_03605 [Acidobacteriota bacterium]
MRVLSLVVLLMASVAVLGLEDSVSVGDRTFIMKDGAWYMEGLPDDFQIEDGYICEHKDDIWQNWYNSGDEQLKKILELGPNIVWMMKSSVDGKEHVFAVSDGDHFIAFLPKAAGLSKAAKAGLIVGGAAATAVIIDNLNDDDEASKAKR